MPSGTVDYILIDGKRYRMDRNAFKRMSLPVELPQLKAIRSQSPFIDAEVVAFDGGVLTDDLDDSGNWYRDALGMEPTGPNQAKYTQLKVGKQLVAAGTGTPSAMATTPALLSFKGNLIAVGGLTLQYWAGAAWANGTTFATTARLIIEYLGGTVAALTPGGNVFAYSTDGTTYTEAGGALSKISSWAVLGSKLYCVLDDSPAATLYTKSTLIDVPATANIYLDEPTSAAACTLGTVLYLVGIDTTAGYAKIYSYDGTTFSRLDKWLDTYPIAAARFNGKIYYAMKSGDLFSFDGTDLTFVRNFGTVQCSCGVALGALWVSACDGTNTTLWRLDPVAGWSQPHYVVGATVPTNVASYAGRIVCGYSAVVVKEQSAALRVTAATLEMPDVVYGVPSTKKAGVSATLAHSALLTGQTVQIRYKLDGGAEVTVTPTNSDIGDTETTVSLPKSVIGTRIRPKWYIVNGSGQDLTVYGMRLRSVPLPGEREVWESSLKLYQHANMDGTADAYDDLQKFDMLQDLRRSGRYFQVVDPFRLTDTATGQPRAAMQAFFDGQTPLDWRLTELKEGNDLILPVRLIQALGDHPGIKNVGFELDTTGAAPGIWTSTGASATGCTMLVQSGAAAAEGNNGLVLTFGGSGPTYGAEQTIAGLVGGRYYTVGAQIKRTLSAGTVRLHVSSTGLGVGTPALASATDPDFVYYQTVFQLPAANSAFTVKLIGEGSPVGSVAFDAIRVRE